MSQAQTTEPAAGSARAHLNWCVERAMEYADQGQMPQAWASFISDCRKHQGTEFIARDELLAMTMASGICRTPTQFRDFISGWAVRS